MLLMKSTCTPQQHQQAQKARRAAAVVLTLLGVAQAGTAGQDPEAHQMLLKDAVSDVPAALLKNMVLNLLEEEADDARSDQHDEPSAANEKPRRAPRLRTPDMKSPLEEAKERKKGKSKYEKQYDKRQRKEGPQKDSDTARALEDFQYSDELANLSTIERSLEENRRQREYLLRQHRRTGEADDNGDAEKAKQDAPVLDPSTAPLSKEERKRRKKEAKAAKKEAQEQLLAQQMPKPPKPSDFSDFTPEFKPANKRFDKDLPDKQSDEQDKPAPKKKKKGEKSKYELLAEQFEGEQYKEDDWSEDSSSYEAANDLQPQNDKKKKRKKKTPAKRQKEENAKHFEELQELKKKTEGEDYELPKPKKPERQEVKPSSTGDEDGKTPDSGKHNFDFNEEPEAAKDDVNPESAKDKPKKKKSDVSDADSSDDDSDEDSTASHKDQDENALMPDNSPRKKHDDGDADEEEDPDLARLNRYEKALRDNENEKSRFQEELKKDREARAQQIKEEKEAKEKADREHKEWLEQIMYETGEIPPELQEIYDEEKRKAQEEEAKRRPEPPTAKKMRERVAEETKRRRDIITAERRKKDEEERMQKLKERQEETKRRRETDPNYEPPPPKTVPKGKPAPPADYKYPESARKHGWGAPMDDEEIKKKKEEDEKKEKAEKEAKEEKERQEEAERKLKEHEEKQKKAKKERDKQAKKAKKEREREQEELDQLERPGPTPETKRNDKKKKSDPVTDGKPTPETKKPAKAKKPKKSEKNDKDEEKKPTKKRRRKVDPSAKPSPPKQQKPKPEHAQPPRQQEDESESDENDEPVKEQRRPRKEKDAPKKPQPKHEELQPVAPAKEPGKKPKKPSQQKPSPKKQPAKAPAKPDRKEHEQSFEEYFGDDHRKAQPAEKQPHESDRHHKKPDDFDLRAPTHEPSSRHEPSSHREPQPSHERHREDRHRDRHDHEEFDTLRHFETSHHEPHHRDSDRSHFETGDHLPRKKDADHYAEPAHHKEAQPAHKPADHHAKQPKVPLHLEPVHRAEPPEQHREPHYEAPHRELPHFAEPEKPHFEPMPQHYEEELPQLEHRDKRHEELVPSHRGAEPVYPAGHPHLQPVSPVEPDLLPEPVLMDHDFGHQADEPIRSFDDHHFSPELDLQQQQSQHGYQHFPGQPETHYTIPAPVVAPQMPPLSDFDELKQMKQMPGLPAIARRAFASEDLVPVQQWRTRGGDAMRELPQIYDQKYFELDKKTGQERGRHTEREEASDSSSLSLSHRWPLLPLDSAVKEDEAREQRLRDSFMPQQPPAPRRESPAAPHSEYQPRRPTHREPQQPDHPQREQRRHREPQHEPEPQPVHERDAFLRVPLDLKGDHDPVPRELWNNPSDDSSYPKREEHRHTTDRYDRYATQSPVAARHDEQAPRYWPEREQPEPSRRPRKHDYSHERYDAGYPEPFAKLPLDAEKAPYRRTQAPPASERQYTTVPRRDEKRQEQQRRPKPQQQRQPYSYSVSQSSLGGSSMDEFYRDQGDRGRKQAGKKRRTAGGDRYEDREASQHYPAHQQDRRRTTGRKHHITDEWEHAALEHRPVFDDEEYQHTGYDYGRRHPKEPASPAPQQRPSRYRDEYRRHDDYQRGYQTEPVGRSDFELFQESYDYEEPHEDRHYRGERHRQSRQPRYADEEDYHKSRRRTQPDYYERDRRYALSEDDRDIQRRARQPHRRAYSAEDDDGYYRHEPHPYRSGRKARQARSPSASPDRPTARDPAKKKSKGMHLPELHPSMTPLVEAVPQKPAQQWVIPSTAPDGEGESSASLEEDTSESALNDPTGPRPPRLRKKLKPAGQPKDVVPVMRRHGEPLMVMPDWQHQPEAGNRHPASTHPANAEEPPAYEDSSDDQFYEATKQWPFRVRPEGDRPTPPQPARRPPQTPYPYHRQYQNGIPVDAVSAEADHETLKSDPPEEVVEADAIEATAVEADAVEEDDLAHRGLRDYYEMKVPHRHIETFEPMVADNEEQVAEIAAEEAQVEDSEAGNDDGEQKESIVEGPASEPDAIPVVMILDAQRPSNDSAEQNNRLRKQRRDHDIEKAIAGLRRKRQKKRAAARSEDYSDDSASSQTNSVGSIESFDSEESARMSRKTRRRRGSPKPSHRQEPQRTEAHHSTPRHFKTRDHDARRAARHAKPAHRPSHSPEESYSSDEYDEEEPRADDIDDDSFDDDAYYADAFNDDAHEDDDDHKDDDHEDEDHEDDDHEQDDPEEQESFDSEEIIDQFERAMDMLRHRSHGFNGFLNLESNGGLPSEFASVKEHLRQGGHLDELRIEHDWDSQGILDAEARRAAVPGQGTRKLSLKELLADEEKLIADYERKIAERERRREERRLAEAEQANMFGHEPEAPQQAQKAPAEQDYQEATVPEEAPFPEPRRPAQPARVVPAPVYEIASLHEHSRRPEQHKQSQQREFQHAAKPVEKHAEKHAAKPVDTYLGMPIEQHHVKEVKEYLQMPTFDFASKPATEQEIEAQDHFMLSREQEIADFERERHTQHDYGDDRGEDDDEPPVYARHHHEELSFDDDPEAAAPHELHDVYHAQGMTGYRPQTYYHPEHHQRQTHYVEPVSEYALLEWEPVSEYAYLDGHSEPERHYAGQHYGGDYRHGGYYGGQDSAHGYGKPAYMYLQSYLPNSLPTGRDMLAYADGVLDGPFFRETRHRWNDLLPGELVPRTFGNDLLPNQPEENAKKKRGGKGKPTAPARKPTKGKKPAPGKGKPAPGKGKPAPAKKGHPAAPAPEKRSPAMKEEMDYLAHQRLLKDRSMRRRRERQQPKGLPALPPAVPSKKDKVDPATGKPVESEQFDMMGYMKRQLLAKEREMLKKELDDPDYKPLSPTAKKPTAVPHKDLEKLAEAQEKRRQRDLDGAGDKRDKSLFDQISREKMLRERQLRGADPDYAPLSPTAKPGKKRRPRYDSEEDSESDEDEDEENDEDEPEDTIFEQMRKRRLAHERKLLEEDSKRAAEDPTYTPKFKGLPNPEQSQDPKGNLKRRLDEARRRHREEREEQFEDELYEEELYDDGKPKRRERDLHREMDFGHHRYSDYDDEYGDSDDDYARQLDYYYDEQGFAHPKKSKGRPGRDRFDPYNVDPVHRHMREVLPVKKPTRNPQAGRGRRSRRNEQDETQSSDSYSATTSSAEESFDEDQSSSQYDEGEARPRFKPNLPGKKEDARPRLAERSDDGYSQSEEEQYSQSEEEQYSQSEAEPYSQSEEEEERYSTSSGNESFTDDESDYQDQSFEKHRAPLKRHHDKRAAYLNHLEAPHNEAEALALTHNEYGNAPKPHLLMNLMSSGEPFTAQDTKAEKDRVRKMLVDAHLNAKQEDQEAVDAKDEPKSKKEEEAKPEPEPEKPEEPAKESPSKSAQESAADHEEIDELYKELQKELHTRFKNMFEGDMLLPNLDYNPNFEGKTEANLLSLEEQVLENHRRKMQELELKQQHELVSDSDSETEVGSDQLLQLAQEDNWLHSRSFWTPKRIRELEPKWETNSNPFFYEDGEDDAQEQKYSNRVPEYARRYYAAGMPFY